MLRRDKEFINSLKIDKIQAQKTRFSNQRPDRQKDPLNIGQFYWNRYRYDKISVSTKINKVGRYQL